jgi:carbon-monoxide dehydrogenase small subunit
MIALALTVNGERHELAVAPNVTLLELLRGELHLTGAKEGCGAGECGACLVLLDGLPVASCLVLAVDADGRRVETVEGLAGDGVLDALQAAFVEQGAVQCGYCTPAMVLAAEELLRRSPHPGPEETAEALAGVLCRCGTYPRVLAAIRAAAAAGDGR